MTPQDSGLIANYLLDHPHFFEEHAELLGQIKLTSPLLGRAISLQERQIEILREKIKVQELHLADLLRIAQENDEIVSKFQLWTHTLLLAERNANLPRILSDSLQTSFHVPQVTLRLWNTAQHDNWFTADVTEEIRTFASALSTPFCGPNKNFAAANWLAEAVSSIAMLPLRTPAETFGLLVLGSPEPDRFSADKGTDFLVRMGATASAALTCLLR